MIKPADLTTFYMYMYIQVYALEKKCVEGHADMNIKHRKKA